MSKKKSYLKKLKEKRKKKTDASYNMVGDSEVMSTERRGKVIDVSRNVVTRKDGAKGATKQVNVKNPITGKTVYMKATSYSTSEKDEKGKKKVLRVKKGKGAKQDEKKIKKAKAKRRIKKIEKKVRKSLARKYN